MGDLIPFRPSGMEGQEETLEKFMMHVRKMREAKTRAEINHHFRMAKQVLEKARHQNDKS